MTKRIWKPNTSISSSFAHGQRMKHILGEAIQIAKHARLFDAQRESKRVAGHCATSSSSFWRRHAEVSECGGSKWMMILRNRTAAEDIKVQTPRRKGLSNLWTSQVETRMLLKLTRAQQMRICASRLLAEYVALRDDQRRAFDIITWHLKHTLNSREPLPLRMIIHGEGGTGKSKVIQCLTKKFEELGVAHLLVRGAYTGIAASPHRWQDNTYSVQYIIVWR